MTLATGRRRDFVDLRAPDFRRDAPGGRQFHFVAVEGEAGAGSRPGTGTRIVYQMFVSL